MLEPPRFKPGQFLVLRLNNEPALTRSLSISSSPTDTGFLEVTKRITASDFSRTLNQLMVGATVNVRFPLGDFTFTGEHPRVAFLCGGIGITPCISMLRHASETSIASEMVLFFSNRNSSEVVFKPELDQLAEKNDRIRVIYTLSQEKAAGTHFGRIDADLIRTHLPDFQSYHFYICGAPAMVSGLSELLLQKLELAEEQLHIENFEGY